MLRDPSLSLNFAGTSQTRRGESRQHLNALSQESSAVLKEPIGIVYTDSNSSDTAVDITDIQVQDSLAKGVNFTLWRVLVYFCQICLVFSNFCEILN